MIRDIVEDIYGALVVKETSREDLVKHLVRAQQAINDERKNTHFFRLEAVLLEALGARIKKLEASSAELLEALEGLQRASGNLRSEIEGNQTTCPACGGCWGDGDDSRCTAYNTLIEAEESARTAIAKAKGES